MFSASMQISAKELTVRIKKEMLYLEAREILINAGWQSVIAHSTPNGTPICFKVQEQNDESLANSEACKYKEIDSCSGTGMGFCAMGFFDGKETYLSITTSGGEPPDAEIFSWRKVRRNEIESSAPQTNSLPKHSSENGSTPAQSIEGPSFDCVKARSRTEKIICSDPELSSLDFNLASLFATAKARAPDPNEFKRQAAAEWNLREQTCTERSCLIQWYERRKRQLTSQVNGVPSVIVGSSSSVNNYSSSPMESAELTTKKEKSWLQRNIIYVGIVAILVLGTLLIGFFERCLGCRKLFSRVEESRDLISSNVEYQTVTRTDEHRAPDGSVTGTTKRKEQVAVNVSTYYVCYKCKRCNHQWTAHESRTSNV
jgi:hypothetical protein